MWVFRHNSRQKKGQGIYHLKNKWKQARWTLIKPFKKQLWKFSWVLSRGLGGCFENRERLKRAHFRAHFREHFRRRVRGSDLTLACSLSLSLHLAKHCWAKRCLARSREHFCEFCCGFAWVFCACMMAGSFGEVSGVSLSQQTRHERCVFFAYSWGLFTCGSSLLLTVWEP